ncbi:hypothetical protein HDV06_004908 [Boothiomyces sp. JEL0866]|nr:hypothetical protein HDV06_004908 [Boothiomyces sp. JEL0866]
MTESSFKAQFKVQKQRQDHLIKEKVRLKNKLKEIKTKVKALKIERNFILDSMMQGKEEPEEED